MQLFLFIVAVMTTGSLAYLLLCALYFGSTRRPLLLAVNLSWKLTLVTIFGAVLGGVGGVILSAVIINTELSGLPGYSKVRDITAALVLPILATAFLFFDITYLAFGMLD